MSDRPSCPVCESNADIHLLEARDSVPTIQNTTLSSIETAINFPVGNLEMMFCCNCGFVWNNRFNETEITYDADYNNDVSQSAFYRQHIEKMAERVVASIPEPQEIHYVEIGCGEGEFMELVIEKSNGRCVSATGFDPSFSNEGRLSTKAVVHKCFFDSSRLNLIPTGTNVVCSRHTMEHVSDVHGFAAPLGAIADRTDTRIFLETPDVNWILKRAAFQDFFYEHCSLYSPSSIQALFSRYGLSAETEPVYAGQYMWTELSKQPSVEQEWLNQLEPSLAKTYSGHVEQMKSDWCEYLEERCSVGPVAIWGAASKGVTFCVLFASLKDISVACAIDLNPAKQGGLLPITGIEVVGPEKAKQMGVKTIIIMNPNYETEIRIAVGDLNWAPEIRCLNN